MTHKLTAETAKLYKDAWERWGEYAQLTMVNEECAEVIQAVCKLLRKKNDCTIDGVVEEMVDATIMFEQFLLLFDRKSKYFALRDYKLDRLKGRLHA